ncbi:Dicer-like protein 1 [Saitoella coloradoensis]
MAPQAEADGTNVIKGAQLKNQSRSIATESPWHFIAEQIRQRRQNELRRDNFAVSADLSNPLSPLNGAENGSTADDFLVDPEASNVQVDMTINDYFAKGFEAPTSELLARSSKSTEGTIPSSVVEEDNDKFKVITDPRPYQLELFERAKEGNIIAVLDTGSGKTMIACLLLKHILTVERERRTANPERPKRLAFFVVDSVPLVFQQHAVLQANTPFNIAKFVGEMGTDLWSESQWRKIFSEVDAVVLTADILHNCLVHGFIHMREISLLIFDECHRAKKKHVFARIMRTFYHDTATTPVEERPKVMGMTASPIEGTTKANVTKVAEELEQTLDAQVMTAMNLSSVASLAQAANRPKEVKVSYKGLGGIARQLQLLVVDRTVLTPLYTALYNVVSTVGMLKKAFDSSAIMYHILGPWCADRLWAYTLSELEFKLDNASKFDQFVDPEGHQRERIAIAYANDIINNWSFTKPVITGDREIDERMFSDKILVLLNLLGGLYADNPEGHCIVFVERRSTAHSLFLLLKELDDPRLAPIRPEFIVGHGSAGQGDVAMKYKKQNHVIRQFRKSRVNLLIATSVAEEGLDLPACDTIVRFDPCGTMIRYIQSRGRARRGESIYVDMVDSELTGAAGIPDFRGAEQVMRSFCSSLPENRLLGREVDDDDEDDMSLSEFYYVEPSTGAKLSPHGAVSVVYHYCSRLPGDAFTTNAPIFQITGDLPPYRCTIEFPVNSVVHKIVGKVQPNKQRAKQMAAFDACIELRKRGGLDEHLVPVRENLDKIVDVDGEGMQVGTAKALRSYTMKTPDFWKVREGEPLPGQVYATLIKVVKPSNEGVPSQGHRPICLLTRRPFDIDLGIIQLFSTVEAKVYANAECTSLPDPISLSGTQLDILTGYTVRVMSMVANRSFTCDPDRMPYWVTFPTTREDGKVADLLPWEEIQAAVSRKHTPCPANLSDLQDKVLLEAGDDRARYRLASVRTDLNPLSQPPAGSREARFESFLEYTERKWRNYEVKVKDFEQSMLEVKIIPRVLNYLHRPTAKDMPRTELHSRTPAYLMPERVLVSTIPAPVFITAVCVPSIMTRIDGYLIASEVNHMLGTDVTPYDTLAALTPPAGNMEFDLERMELLGDSFLKLITSLYLYVTEPDNHEGQLHVKRMRQICNANLYRLARDKGLYSYIRPKPFARANWRPAGFVAEEDKEDTVANIYGYVMGDKGLADVVEALIGTAFYYGGLDQGVKAALALGIKMPGIEGQWSDFSRLYDYVTSPRPDIGFSSQDVRGLTKIIGYEFKQPLLLTEALTHASINTTNIPCYQRLEFLGDALLETTVLLYFLKRYPNHSEGRLTELKSAMVSNKILAALCVRLGLHSYINHFSAALPNAVNEYVTDLEYHRLDHAEKEYWLDLDAPKFLSDIVESTLGAIFLDSGFDLRHVDEFFVSRLLPLFTTDIKPTVRRHPMACLIQGMQAWGCAIFEFQSLETIAEDGDHHGAPLKRAMFVIHGHVFATGEGPSLRQARLDMAYKALREARAMNSSEPNIFPRVYCDCPPRMRTVASFEKDDGWIDL